ncbi:hypothetical protein [Kutzneria albida]|uniref:N-acetyltransferase domain-containing protein n=1 Tax=Kutzneria albida DSM 43870 TaxID=1449976 RepID=W5W638_9PSEU|nr:hypothetical protein [Kutzneria albida]AHH96663.1 hypothetical protein KALB_3296 [Kutzneria albida DSM 43870]
MDTDFEAEAGAAARDAGVDLRGLHELSDLAEVQALFESIWRPEPGVPPVTVEWLRAFAQAGNYVVGAFRRGQLVGASVAFFGPPHERSLHSHITGVTPGGQGRRVGYAIKLHQRAWALDNGVTTVRWTFDPLVARNAYFNVTKLGAHRAVYLPGFYGDMPDALNSGDDSDRLLLTWDLAGQRPAAEWEPVPGTTVGLSVDGDELPVRGSLNGRFVLVAVPRDIYQLRLVRPEAARAWRGAVREVLGELLAEGAVISAFTRSGRYVLDRGESVA